MPAPPVPFKNSVICVPTVIPLPLRVCPSRKDDPSAGGTVTVSVVPEIDPVMATLVYVKLNC